MKEYDLGTVNDTIKVFNMLDYCHNNFKYPSKSTWELSQLSKIIFHKESYYTMFIMYWE